MCVCVGLLRNIVFALGDLCGSIQEELQLSEDMKSIALHTCSWTALQIFQCTETPVNICDINILLKRCF